MNQPDPIYPGLNYGQCVMKVTGSEPYNLTISNTRGPCLVITPHGELLMPGITPSEAADLLIDMFARSYGSKLLQAEAKALAVETHNKALERRLKDAEDKAKGYEKLMKRGVVDVLSVDPPPKRPGLLGRYARREMSSDKARQDATSSDKDWDDDPSG